MATQPGNRLPEFRADEESDNDDSFEKIDITENHSDDGAAHSLGSIEGAEQAGQNEHVIGEKAAKEVTEVAEEKEEADVVDGDDSSASSLDNLSDVEELSGEEYAAHDETTKNEQSGKEEEAVIVGENGEEEERDLESDDECSTQASDSEDEEMERTAIELKEEKKDEEMHWKEVLIAVLLSLLLILFAVLLGYGIGCALRPTTTTSPSDMPRIVKQRSLECGKKVSETGEDNGKRVTGLLKEIDALRKELENKSKRIEHLQERNSRLSKEKEQDEQFFNAEKNRLKMEYLVKEKTLADGCQLEKRELEKMNKILGGEIDELRKSRNNVEAQKVVLDGKVKLLLEENVQYKSHENELLKKEKTIIDGLTEEINRYEAQRLVNEGQVNAIKEENDKLNKSYVHLKKSYGVLFKQLKVDREQATSKNCSQDPHPIRNILACAGLFCIVFVLLCIVGTYTGHLPPLGFTWNTTRIREVKISKDDTGFFGFALKGAFISTINGGAAALSGKLKEGDEIVAVDSKNVETLSVKEIKEMIRASETVTLYVRSNLNRFR